MLLLEKRALAPVELHPASTPPPPTNRVRLRPCCQLRTHGIHPDVLLKAPVILQIIHAMIREARLPHGRPRFQAIRKSSFNELHDALEGNLRRRGQ